MMHKLPALLLPRFPVHQETLKAFATPKDFHVAHPVGHLLDGTDVTEQKPVPIFASELLEKLTTEILMPVLTFKKHQSLLAQVTPLAMPFVKDMLPELDSMYAMERASAMAAARASSDMGAVMDATEVAEELAVTRDEADALQAQWEQSKEEVRSKCAEAHVAANVVFCKWSSNILDFISALPMMQDNAACLWWFAGGTDCTKDPARRLSSWRMKAVVDEGHATMFVDVMSKVIRDSVTAIIVAGRNAGFFRDMKKMVQALKPKVGIREFVMEPDEATVCKLLRLESNAVGSVDLSDPYLQVIKSPKMWKLRKAADRKFVPGNTAFKAMSGIPILSKENMTLVPFMEREAMFKTIVPNDKWNTAKKDKGADAEGDDNNDGDEDDDDVEGSAPTIADESTKVPLFYMELHPRVCLEFFCIWLCKRG
jgi:hypothetical protein